MRLADFIETNTDSILAEWVSFAKTCGPAGGAMDLDALRDHAVQMLEMITEDLRTPQTAEQASRKSMGKAPDNAGDPETPAEVHGAGRAESGFSVGDMVAEYRALRASVIRLWMAECKGLTREEDITDLMRFNEAIDQSLAESITRYTSDIDHSREMLVGILGHDLRTPLGAVMTASQFMLDTGELTEPHLTLTTRIGRSARRMNQMVGDLLDLTRTRLGSGIPIVLGPVDLAREASDAVEEVRSAHPECEIQLTTSGDLQGSWDCARISQVMANLLGNAVQHGAAHATVTMTAWGEGSEVVMQVHNRGRAIPQADLTGIFSPFKHIEDDRPSTSTSSLGLGLYIADRIVTGHGGTITVDSSEAAGTTFTVRLPRFVVPAGVRKM